MNESAELQARRADDQNNLLPTLEDAFYIRHASTECFGERSEQSGEEVCPLSCHHYGARRCLLVSAKTGIREVNLTVGSFTGQCKTPTHKAITL